ncbi:MAG: hypothetical protein JXB10_05640 [Pirellulales bacterium]|nr:hypothetical protein [Pirellulales bacterium]
MPTPAWAWHPTIIMHYQTHITVRLHQPLSLGESAGVYRDQKATGYMIIVWVNAACFSEAARIAEEIALHPKNADGKQAHYRGDVVEAEIQTVEEDHIPDEVLASIGRGENTGRYCSTGLIFFEHEE